MLFANAFFETRVHPQTGEDVLLLRAMPVMLGVLCVLAIAYRFYSAFLAAKVAAFDDRRQTPAHQFNDGQNYHPTNRWVLSGITSPRSPGPARSSARSSPCSTAMPPDFSGF